MANSTCTNLLKVVALRVLRLDDDGSILSGLDSMYVHKAPIKFGYTPTQPAREDFSLTDGNGDQCAKYKGPVRAVDGVDLTMDLCVLDAELMELLCGGSVITDVDYGTIGYDPPTDDTINEFGVAVETWSIQWNRRQRALLNGNPAFYRHVFPLTHWTAPPVSEENGFATITITGSSEQNSGFGSGLAADPQPLTIGDVPYRWFIDDEVPDGACGYLEVAA